MNTDPPLRGRALVVQLRDSLRDSRIQDGGVMITPRSMPTMADALDELLRQAETRERQERHDAFVCGAMSAVLYPTGGNSPDDIARDAIAIADRVLAQLEKRG